MPPAKSRRRSGTASAQCLVAPIQRAAGDGIASSLGRTYQLFIDGGDPLQVTARTRGRPLLRAKVHGRATGRSLRSGSSAEPAHRTSMPNSEIVNLDPKIATGAALSGDWL